MATVRTYTLSLNIGLKTYLGGELSKSQIETALNALWNSGSKTFEIREELGSYEGILERTAVVQILFPDYVANHLDFIRDLCSVLAQESIAWKLEGQEVLYKDLTYHRNYHAICELQGKSVNLQVFNGEFFINF